MNKLWAIVFLALSACASVNSNSYDEEWKSEARRLMAQMVFHAPDCPHGEPESKCISPLFLDPRQPAIAERYAEIYVYADFQGAIDSVRGLPEERRLEWIEKRLLVSHNEAIINAIKRAKLRAEIRASEDALAKLKWRRALGEGMQQMGRAMSQPQNRPVNCSGWQMGAYTQMQCH